MTHLDPGSPSTEYCKTGNGDVRSHSKMLPSETVTPWTVDPDCFLRPSKIIPDKLRDARHSESTTLTQCRRTSAGSGDDGRVRSPGKEEKE